MKRGNIDVTNLKRGSTNVNKAMRGTTLIWERGATPPQDGDIEVITHAGQSAFGFYSSHDYTVLNEGNEVVYPGGTTSEIPVVPETLIKIFLDDEATSISFGGSGTINETAVKYIKVNNIKGITSLGNDFAWMELLETFEIGNEDVFINVTNFEGTFQVSKMDSIPQFNAPNMINARSMFNMCSNLTSIPALDYSQCTDFYRMFRHCESLVEIPGTLDFTNLTDGTATFENCNVMVQPPPTGTPVRDGDNALAGTWTNPGV